MDRSRNPDEDDAFRRRVAESVDSDADDDADGGTTESSDDGPETYAVREGVTRAIDPEDYSSISSDQELVQETTHNRVESMGGGFEPQRPLDLPPDLPESIDVASVAPDGTAIGGSRLTSPTGEAVGGSGLSDAIQSRAGELGGDAFGRGIDFDPSSPGTNDSAPGGQETTGDPSVDRAIMGRDGSLISEQELPKYDPDAGPRRTLPKEQQPAAPKEDRILPDWVHDVKDYLIPPKEEPKPPPKDVYQENPEGDSVDSATNLERVTVMQGSAVNPSTNPNDGGDSGTTDNYIPPADLETMPAQEGAVAGTTLTSAAGLGSSPVTNPTDPVFGDDGIIHGGNYSGGGGTGGGETTPLSSEAEGAPALQAGTDADLGAGASSLGGGEAALPITLRTGPAASGGAVEQKTDVNGATVDMVTGQVIGSAAPASGGELSAAGGMVSQGDEGDEDEGVHSFGPGAESDAAAPAFGTAAPMAAGLAAGGMVSQGDEGDEDEGFQSFGATDASQALGASDAGLGIGAPGSPGALEGPPAIGEDGPPQPGEDGPPQPGEEG